MRIVICIKQVPDTNAYIEIDPLTGEIDRDDIVYIVNPFDMVAVEEGLRVKENVVDSEITVISMGPSRVKDALRSCLSTGPVDKAVHLHDKAFEGLDKYFVSLVLAKAIDNLGYDLILCGKQSIDDNDGQIGANIAQLLNIPQVSDIVKLELSHDNAAASVLRLLERGDIEEVECGLPALFTVNMRLNTPRYPSFPDSLNALKKEIVEFDAESLGLRSDIIRHTPFVDVVDVSFPKPRPRNIVLPDSNLPVHERLDFIMSGGISDKESELLEGDPKKIASKVVDLLFKEKVI